jgi:hypothetical protein
MEQNSLRLNGDLKLMMPTYFWPVLVRDAAVA